jgi:hypothetical protein
MAAWRWFFRAICECGHGLPARLPAVLYPLFVQTC